MESEWEEFPHGPAVKSGERVHVTLNRQGCFFLNDKAIRAMGEPDFVVLKYDRRHAKIGIVPAKSSQTNAFKLKRKDKTRSRGRALYAMNFLRYFHIHPEETLAFPTAEVDKTGTLILSLHEIKSVSKPKPKA